ncbi:allatostatin double C [Haematobia irritans]|uniref:allatostatin double C n=1 Tax=Haematobia irritans TaxID=7368 RepID=UPI003F501DEE
MHQHHSSPVMLYCTIELRIWMKFLLVLILMHRVQSDWSNPHETRKYMKRRGRDEVPLSSFETTGPLPVEKRTLISATGNGGSISQPEEIFSINNQLESNYDEYPMVVPKRAALLLDRLMVALHHALEKERTGSARLSDFYNKINNEKYSGSLDKGNGDISDEKDSPYFTMYSDDDPSVLMDYDFKDLNSINRATGETLMAQSFQRRANLGLDLGGDIRTDGVSSLLAASSSDHRGLISTANKVDIASVGSAGRTNVGNNGRMYWRCYFNAVSCF